MQDLICFFIPSKLQAFGIRLINGGIAGFGSGRHFQLWFGSIIIFIMHGMVSGYQIPIRKRPIQQCTGTGLQSSSCQMWVSYKFSEFSSGTICFHLEALIIGSGMLRPLYGSHCGKCGFFIKENHRITFNLTLLN